MIAGKAYVKYITLSIALPKPYVMTERLLQFIWQFQYYNKSQLHVEDGEKLSIIYPGQYNTNQGPDFLNAKIVIGNTTLAGNIELHVTSSDWLKHNHTADQNYSNIILHVVWQHDTTITNTQGAVIATLVLENLVPKVLLQRYETLMTSQQFVPCENYLPVLTNISWLAWKERLAVERLQRKAATVISHLANANNHWEEGFWRMLARNFGMKTNADIFEEIAKTLPVNILAKHKNQIHQLEALLLGQAGLLEDNFSEDYPKLLQREYRFLKKKYQLQSTSVKPYFLRMRPANFPTIRLAQLAMLVHQSSHLFSKTKEMTDVNEVIKLLNVTANDYWHYHYLFDEPAEYQPKQTGRQMVENILINTIIVVLFAYGIYHSDEALKDKSLQWLSALAAEKNSITNKWTTFGVTNTNALESQALIELKNNYCNVKRCLECAVGNAILKGVERWHIEGS